MINVILVRHLNELCASSEILATLPTMAQARRYALRYLHLGKRQDLQRWSTWDRGGHGYALRLRATLE